MIWQPSDAVLVSIVTGLFGALNTWLIYRTGKSVKDVKKDISAVVEHTNGMKDQLIKLTNDEAFARGVKSGGDKMVADIMQSEKKDTL